MAYSEAIAAARRLAYKQVAPLREAMKRKAMGRRPANTELLRARVPRDIKARTELRLYSAFDGKRKYGAMSDLITSLLVRWLKEVEEREDGSRPPNSHG